MTSGRSSSRRQTRPDHSFPSQPPQGGCVSTLKTFGNMVIRQSALGVYPCAMGLLCELGAITRMIVEPAWKASLVATVRGVRRPDVRESSMSGFSRKTPELARKLQMPRPAHNRRRHQDLAQILASLKKGPSGSLKRAEWTSARVHPLDDLRTHLRHRTGARLRAAHLKSMTRGAPTRRGIEDCLRARLRLTTKRG